MEITEKTNNNKWLLIQAMVFGLLGMIMMLFPDAIPTVLSSIIAVALFLLGISAVWAYIKQRKADGKNKWYLLLGTAFTMAVGICLLIFPNLLELLLATAAGIWMLIRSVQIIGTAITLRSFGAVDWAWFVLVGLLVLLIAVLTLAFPGAITRLAIILLGVASLLISAYYFIIYAKANKPKN
jgi:uncharacterized membrane protein HdeD (DUF308 family)